MQNSVLIVDDNDTYRASLVEQMSPLGFEGVGCASGGAAIDLVAADPRRFQFAVIDQVLDHGMDGIEATSRLVQISSSLCVLVFTRLPSDDPETIARFKYEALSAGAFRYLERGPEGHAPKQIQDFVREMQQLTQLRDWLRDHYENRANVLPSLLTQLDIGVDVIDRSYKILYMNRAMRRIVGMAGEDLPKAPCPVWHEYKCCPCPGCLLTKTLTTKESGERYYLVPLPLREPGRFFFTRVWVQPLSDASGKPLLGEDGKPLAVMESVQDLTGSPQWRQMSLENKLDILAQALRDCPDPKRYVATRCFDRVRVLVPDRANATRFILQAAQGFHPELQIGAPVDLAGSHWLDVAEDNMRRWGYGYCFPEDFPSPDALSLLGERQRYIYWPVIKQDRTVALLEAIGPGCNRDTVDVMRPYAEKVSEILEEERSAPLTLISEADNQLAKIDLRLQTESALSPKKALRLLVQECCQMTCSKFPVLRYRDQDDAVLVRLKVSPYEGVARERFPLAQMTSWSARTMVSGQQQVASMAQHAEAILAMRKNMSPEAQAVLDGVQSLCFLPLLLEGRCIGSLGLHSVSQDNYSDQKIAVARSIANRVAFALHDYLVELRGRQQVEEAQDSTIGLVLHNINGPLGTLNNELQFLLDEVSSSSADRSLLASGLERIKDQAKRIARVRSEYLKLRKPWKSRLEVVDLATFLQEVARECAGKARFSLVKELGREPRRTRLDTTGLRVCLEVLVGNAVDALAATADPAITVSLRRAAVNETEMTDSADPILAIDVLDNGPGVPPAIEKDLFRIVKSGKAAGLGFGLSFCHHIATSSGGNVYHHTGVPGGAKFTLLLPHQPVPATGGQPWQA